MTMKTDELLKRLEVDLEWAEAAGEWDVPLCLADDLREAIKILKRKTAADIYEETETGLKVLTMIGEWCEAYSQGREVGDYVGIRPHKVDDIRACAISAGKVGIFDPRRSRGCTEREGGKCGFWWRVRNRKP